MAITQAICNSFKAELLGGFHDLDTDTLKVALYTSSATLGATTTAYSVTDEISGTGYSAGGATITGAVITSGSTSYIDFADTDWSTATFTTRGAVIYNSSKSNRAIAVLDFGSDQTVGAGTFRIEWPAADASNAIIRLA